MVSISSHEAEKGKGMHEATGISQMVTFKQGLMGIEHNHTTTNLLRVSSVAKPRTRKANASIKHRNKQA